MVQRAKIWQTSTVTKLNAPQQEQPGSPTADTVQVAPPADLQPASRPREIGGREGPDPTRYGDWEKGGRCIDF
jgi:hypothetical protein